MLRKANATIALAMALLIQGCHSAAGGANDSPTGAATDVSSSADVDQPLSKAPTPNLVQCKMQKCNWDMELKKYKISKYAYNNGQKIKLDMIVVESIKGDLSGDLTKYNSPENLIKSINWQEGAFKTYYICEKYTPAVIHDFQNHGGGASVLFMRFDEIFAGNDWDVSEYFRICENLKIPQKEIYDQENMQMLIEKYGYKDISWHIYEELKFKNLESAMTGYLNHVDLISGEYD